MLEEGVELARAPVVARDRPAVAGDETLEGAFRDLGARRNRKEDGDQDRGNDPLKLPHGGGVVAGEDRQSTGADPGAMLPPAMAENDLTTGAL